MRFVLCLLAACAVNAEERLLETLYPAWGQSFAIDRIVHSEKSDFWNLTVFENQIFGRVLAIDGIIQLTEGDEAFYSEMMAHVPILAHGNAESVLIVGGGDGCILREVLKHETVQKATLVEIDPAVIETTKKFFPNLAQGAFDDPRVEVVIQDAIEYVKKKQNAFDVIICDSTDPIGPAKALFAKEFCENCKNAMKIGGIMVNQNGVPFLQKEEMAESREIRKQIFPFFQFYSVPVPTYAGGFMAIGWGSDRPYRVTEKVLKERMKKVKGTMKYYTPAVHRAAFGLPEYMN